MADVEKLLRDYISEHRSGGEADPRSYLARAEGAERVELAALIDSYLSRSPGQAWDATAFEGSAAELARDRIAAEWELSSGEVAGQSWRELLPALRNRAQVMRREVVARLADGIGHPGAEVRVGAYYHQMETGKLPAEGVSNRVLTVLGEILGESAERLRAAGSIVVPGGETEAGAMDQVAYARTAVEDPRYTKPAMADMSMEAGDFAEPLADPGEAEVDRLFTGGPGAA